jgi:RNA polymerase sigma factor (sigma-70 family)
MAEATFRPVLHQVRRLVEDRRLAEAPDEELLRRFATGRDGAAFHALLRRHGPMVLDVCRAVLRNEADAEDAFQATFLALARGPGSIRRAAALGSWLYGVAYRTALKAQAGEAKRRRHEARAPGRAAPAAADLTWGEIQRALHEELNALAERHRAPLVLCYLQGKTQDEAAALLGLAKGTLKRRLEQGRALLRARLVRRGLGPAAALAVSAWPSASAAVPEPLATAALQAATLTGRGLKTMLPTKLTTLTAALLILATAGTGAAVLSRSGPGPAAGTAAGADRPDRADVFGDPLPPGAVARMGTVRLRHTHPPSQLTTAFSPDGKLLATGGWEEIRVWDLTTGRLLREIRDGDRTRSYCALLFAPDGRWLAGAARGSVCLWDPATGQRLHEFPANGHAVACSPDGRLLAAASQDGSLGVWDTTTGRQTALLRDARVKGVHWPLFTPDGGLVTSAGDRVYSWDLAGGKLTKVVELSVPPSYGIALSPDGRTQAVAGRDEPVSLWDTATGTVRLRLRGELARGGFGLAFSPDGKTLATNATGPYEYADHTTVALWDAATGEPLRHFRLPTCFVNTLRFTPDGRTLLTVGSEPVVRLWDAATGRPALHWPAHAGEVKALDFTPDGRSLVSGSLDGSVRVWEVSSGRQVRELAGHRWRCDVVTASPVGPAVLSGGADGCVRMQDRDGRELRRLLLDGPPENLARPVHHVLALGVAPDGKTATTWGRNPNQGPPVFHVWDLATGRAVVERADLSGSGEIPQLSPDGRLALRSLYEERAGDPARMPGAGGAPGGMTRVCVAVLLDDVATGREVLRLAHPDGFGGPRAFTPDGRALVTVSSRQERTGDGLRYHETLHVWELATGKERLAFSCGTASRWFQRVTASSDGRTVATGRSDGAIQVWDLGTGKELLHRESPGEVNALAFAPDARLLASGHRDGTILVWDLAAAGRPAAGGEPDARQLERWWADLAGDDARAAYAAVRGLGAAPGPAVRFLRERLRPVVEAPPEQLRPLIADLDSPEFPRREAATNQLTAFGERAGPALRAALDAGPSVEKRRRIEQILRTHNAPPSGEALRHLRAVEALERIGTDDAREVLATLARGVTGARLTREAEAALQRLGRRSNAGP